MLVFIIIINSNSSNSSSRRRSRSRRSSSSGCVKCKHSLNTNKAELVRCRLNFLNVLDLTSGGGVPLRGPWFGLPALV